MSEFTITSSTILHPVAEKLLAWYAVNKRQLPWRDVHNAYYTWLSEIILQQTRIDQGWAYYDKFVTNYPTVTALAQASEQEVLRLWQGLGYYSRARSLHATAKQVQEQYGGQFPIDYGTLLSLKGIGPYTAAAIASMAGGQPHAAIDGNAFRVLSRLFAESQDIAAPKARKVFETLAQELLPLHAAGDFNQAMMDLGSTVCTPRKPLCHQCPVQPHCLAFAQRNQEAYPVKVKKIVNLVRYMHFLILQDHAGNIWMRERPAGVGIWQGLWQPPMLETASDADWTALWSLAQQKKQEDEALLELLSTMISNERPIRSVPLAKHQLTHQTLLATAHIIDLSQCAKATELVSGLVTLGYSSCSPQRQQEVPKSVLVEQVLKV